MTKIRSIAVLLGLSLAAPLAGTAWAQDLELGVQTVRSPKEYLDLLEQARTLRAQGQPYEAVDRLAEVLAEGFEEDEYFGEAQFEMVKTLHQLGMYQSAYSQLERIVDAGPTHKHYVEAIDWLLKVHRAVPGDVLTLEKMAEYDPMLYPPAQANEIRFLVGQFHYTNDDLDQALESLTAVEQTDEKPYLRAQYLIGVIHTRRNEAQPALEAFKNVLRYGRDIASNDFVDDMVRKATLSLGRLFYTARQYEAAGRYYDQIEQSDPAWLDSLFEISWTYYQVGNFDRALGNLHTLNSPYFVNEYYPESLILQAVIDLKNCHFPQVLRSVDRFVESYKPLKEELELQLKRTQAPNEFYYYLARLSKEDAQAALSNQLKRVINAALQDKRLRRLLMYVVQLNREVGRLEEMKKGMTRQRGIDYTTALLGDLTSYRELVISDAGEAAKSRLDRVRAELTDLLSQALRVKFETLRAQRAMLNLQKTMTAEQVEEQRSQDLARPPADEEHMYWPFDGEYWRDELGAYTYVIANRCLKREAQKATPGPTTTP